ncbi:MAG: acetyltransferase [bacterium]|nr:MAG: acetyltransferase [bacterium]
MKTKFVTAEYKDIEMLVGFTKEFYKHEHIEFDEKAVCAALKKLLDNSSFGNIWLIHYEEQLVGYCVLTLGYSLEFRGRDAFIDEIYVKDDFRGKGIGTKAINFMEQACKTLSVQALHLEVEKSNNSAHALYKKAGFEEHNRYLMTKKIV